MKKITLFLAFFLTFFASGYAQFPAPYCPVVFLNNTEPITLVNFAGINNTSPATVTPSAAGNSHQDFTAVVGAVNAGQSYPIIVKGNTDGGFTTYISFFADWNHDNDFADAGETYNLGTIVGSTGVDAIQLSGNIAVPASALAGSTRMRVVKKFNTYVDACNLVDVTPGTTATYGQAEDYTLTVTAASCTAPVIDFAVVSNCPTNNTYTVTANITSLGNATSLSVNDNQGGTAQTVTAAGSVTFGPYANNVSVVITATHNVDVLCSISSATLSSLACVPGCASTPTPVDGATNVPYGAITLSWAAPTTGGAPDSYDLYAGDTADNLQFLANYTTTTTGTDLQINAYGATIYWQVVPVNSGGEGDSCAVWSFTTAASPGFCLNGTQYPATTFTPTCDGTANEIVANAYAGEYSVVNVSNGVTYIFTSGTTDFVTLSADNGATAAAFGPSPLTWTATVSGPVRFYSHVDDQCGVENVNRSRSVTCTLGNDTPDYANLQFPVSASVAAGSTTTVYGQVYELGLTEADGQAAGINAWVGVNAADTNPATWNETSWGVATFNVQAGNNDEYQANIGAGLAPGTFYYATRFQLNGGTYVYGGIDVDGNGNFWNGTEYNSGVLTVLAPPAPVNDECAGAIELIPAGSFAAGAITTTNVGATSTAVASCQGTSGENVWYSVAVPASGSITVSTDLATGSLFNDSVVSIYSGTCDALTLIICNDDSAGTSNGLFSLVSATGRTPGEVLYISVWRYNSAFSTAAAGTFQIAAYDASLGTNSFDNKSFSYYPNPVKNVLNLSYTQNISDVAVFNLLGQQVIAKSVNANQSQVDMSALSAGTYVVKVTANGKVQTIKVIKE